MGKKIEMGSRGMEEEVARLYGQGGSKRRMERLMALRLGLEGEHTLEEIGKIVGSARSRIIAWVKIAREQGVEALLGIHQGRGRQARVKGKIYRELRRGVMRGRWKRAKEARQWLSQRYGVELSLSGTRYWLKKAGES